MNATKHTETMTRRWRRRPLRSARVMVAAFASAALMAIPAIGSAAPALQITGAGSAVTGLSTPDQIAQTLLGPGVALDGPATINGSANSVDYTPRLPSFGRFNNGDDRLGISDGLIISANAHADTFAAASILPTGASSRTDAELFDVVNAAGLCHIPDASNCVYNATSLEFSVRPTSRYIKFEYALAITESGTWSPPTWSGGLFYYPDGFALFVGGRAVTSNCAVVPQTSTYLTMQTAGIVPPLFGGIPNRAAAQANLDARIADPGAPNGFAYNTDDPTWGVRFLTVPLTCVADVNDAFTAGDPTTIKIVAADINDTNVAPAVFLQGGSVRFSDTSTPAPAGAPSAPAAPSVVPGDGTATVSWDVPADDGGAAITDYTVTSQPDGKTCTTTAPATTCTVAGLTNGTSYTFTVVATNSVGDSSASSVSATVAPSAPPAPPAPPVAPTPQPPVEPDPTPPAAPPVPPTPTKPIATPLVPPVTRPMAGGTGESATQVIHRLRFDATGRYTFIYINRATGKRITQLRGSRIGKRTIARRLSAPVLNNQKAGKRMVLNSRLARRAMPANPNQVALRIILRRPDGTLSAVSMASDGSVMEIAARQ